jgi:TrwC relaxase
MARQRHKPRFAHGPPREAHGRQPCQSSTSQNGDALARTCPRRPGGRGVRLQDVLSLAKLAGADQRYYLDQAHARTDHTGSVSSGAEDYYLSGPEAVGGWTGAASAALELRGRVTEAQLRAVLSRHDPRRSARRGALRQADPQRDRVRHGAVDRGGHGDARVLRVRAGPGGTVRQLEPRLGHPVLAGRADARRARAARRPGAPLALRGGHRRGQVGARLGARAGHPAADHRRQPAGPHGLPRPRLAGREVALLRHGYGGHPVHERDEPATDRLAWT